MVSKNGNATINSMYEANLPSGEKPNSGTMRAQRRQFICRKYERKEFYTEPMPEPTKKQQHQQQEGEEKGEGQSQEHISGNGGEGSSMLMELLEGEQKRPRPQIVEDQQKKGTKSSHGHITKHADRAQGDPRKGQVSTDSSTNMQVAATDDVLAGGIATSKSSDSKLVATLAPSGNKGKETGEEIPDFLSPQPIPLTPSPPQSPAVPVDAGSRTLDISQIVATNASPLEDLP